MRSPVMTMNQTEEIKERPDYGLDAPYVPRNLTLAGLACAVVATASPALRWCYTPAFSMLASAALYYYSSKVGKLQLREKIVDGLALRGDEQVLDAGCGSGLLLVGAAKRLTTGKAVGVDIWRSGDLSNTGRDATLRNARIEGVSEKIRIEEGDIRKLPFETDTFDGVISLNVVHNIASRGEREKALTEIIRVMKPGGRFVIADFRNTGDYARLLRTAGIGDARKVVIGWTLFLPTFAAVGTKPLS